MSTPCIVIIGAAEQLQALRRLADSQGEVLSFSDREPLKAVEAIMTRRPDVIALERLFAATSRGAALINRIKAEPALTGTEIRVVSIDGTYRVSPRRAAARPASSPRGASDASGQPGMTVEVIAPPVTGEATPQNLDYRGTRRAPRFRMAADTEVQVDGVLATLVDLSTLGAQIVCPSQLKPKQHIRMVLADNFGSVTFSADVAWASFEIPKGATRYRAGVEFKDAEASAVDAFCRRHLTESPRG